MNDAELLNIFPAKFHPLLNETAVMAGQVNEIRLRKNAPILIVTRRSEYYISRMGKLSQNKEEAYCMKEEEIEKIVDFLCRDSRYAFEEELKKGFLTLKGGHRVGVAGQAVMDEKGKVKTIKNISSLNIRIAHEVKGVSKNILESIYINRKIQNTLIISPPGYGKTTMLRDIVKEASNGNPFGSPCQVSLIDERSEIAACYNGVPQNDVGARTDVLDDCPKRIGMMMMLRSMAPQLMAIDELGGEEDTKALLHVAHSGCAIIATIHGESIKEVKEKRYMDQLFSEKIFRCIVLLKKTKEKYLAHTIQLEDCSE